MEFDVPLTKSIVPSEDKDAMNQVSSFPFL